MARFRHNQLNIVVEPVYQRDGLNVERVRRFDQTALLPDIEHWRAWSLRVTLNGTRYSGHDGHAYTLAPNTILWHSPLKEVVKTRGLPGTGSDVVVLSFTAQRWFRFIDQHPAFCTHNAELLGSKPGHQLVALQLAPPQLLHVLRRFVVLGRSPRATALALENYSTLLLRLIGDLRFDVAIQSRDDERRQRVELAQGRMVARLAQPPSLQQIAAGLNVSPRQLQRDFLAVTGLTPMRYLNLVRLSEANSLLAESSMPIAEIAALLGYVSQAHFSAAFRQAYGSSPRQVRDSRLGLDLISSAQDMAPIDKD
jgi:AraC-like DNA-binding protein